MTFFIDIHYVGDKWDESQHPRGTGKKGGQFVRKGEGGGSTPVEEGKTPIGSFVQGELSKGTPPEQIAEKLKAVTVLHKNPDYINRMFRHLETKYGLQKGILGKAGGKASPTPKPEPKPEPPAPQPSVTPPTSHSYATPEQRAEMIATKSNALEKGYHEKAWTHATPEFIQAAKNVHPLTDVKSEKKMTSHYSPHKHYINVKPGHGGEHVKQTWNVSTWRHEFGHALDFNGKPINKSFKFHDVMVKESTKVIKSYKKGSGEFQKLSLEEKLAARKKAGLGIGDFSAFNISSTNTYAQDYILNAIHHGAIQTSISKHCLDADDSARLHDFMGAMTMNKVGWGHSTNYYKKYKHFRTAEMFANYVALTQKEGGKVYKALLHSIAPETCAGFDSIITKKANQ